jgi:hypothetical protein
MKESTNDEKSTKDDRKHVPGCGVSLAEAGFEERIVPRSVGVCFATIYELKTCTAAELSADDAIDIDREPRREREAKSHY